MWHRGDRLLEMIVLACLMAVAGSASAWGQIRAMPANTADGDRPAGDAASRHLIRTSRSASSNGRGASTAALTRLNMAVLTPMARAKVITAVMANDGFLRKVRKA